MKQFNAILVDELSEQKPLEIKPDLNVAIDEQEALLPASAELVKASQGLEEWDNPTGGSTIGEGENSMREGSIVQLTRKQLYDEIWEISVAGLARKWNISYSDLMKQIREADIPIPPSGYWTQLRHGKPTTKPELLGPGDAVVSLFKTSLRFQGKTENDASLAKKVVSDSQVPSEGTLLGDGRVDPQITGASTSMISEKDVVQEPEIYTSFGQTYNVYDRETLYKEVWEAPITEIAKRYQVSDVAIHKVCKALDIPKPSRGYWAKLRAGKPVSIKPLPKNDNLTQKMGVRTGTTSQRRTDKETLAFLSGEERELILAIASQILLPGEGARMYPKISTHRQVINGWKKEQKNNDGRGRSRHTAPALAETVSDETIHRVYRIIEALIRAMEPLGCSLADNLNFLVNGETVELFFSEFTDRIPHVPTKEENMKLLKYEEDRKRYSWASKPHMRKYDYVFNGGLKVVIDNKKTFRDCQSYVLEDRLGDIMIELYEAAESIKKAREAREEAERRHQEEIRQKEERRERYNREVDRTLALANLAEDYDTASKIRSYIAVLRQAGNHDDKTNEWIEWAKAKADWYDPTIAKEDEFFGRREHEQDADKKRLEHRSYWR